MKSIIGLFFILVPTLILAQSPILFESIESGHSLWGLKDSETDKVLISPKYTSISYPTDEGFSIVSINEKYGVINHLKGFEVIPAEYDKIPEIFDNRFIVCINERYGLIDQNRKIIIPIKFNVLENIMQGLFKFSETKENNSKVNAVKFGVIDRDGHMITKAKYDAIYSLTKNGEWMKVFLGSIDDTTSKREWIHDGKFGLLNSKGEEITPIKYDYISTFSYTDDLFEVRIRNPNDKENIKFLKTIDYDDIKEYKSYKIGFIDKNGDEVIPLQYDGLQNPNDQHIYRNYSIIKASITELKLDEDGYDLKVKFGIINTSTKKFSKVVYDRINELIVSVQLLDKEENYIGDKYGLLNENGEEITPMKYDYLIKAKYGIYKYKAFIISEDKYSGKKVGKYGFINSLDEEVIPLKYDRINFYFNDSLGIAKFEGKFGYLNHRGETVLPFKYDAINFFYDGLALAKFEGKFGYLNDKGEIVIPFKYDSAHNFKDGKAKVNLKSETFFINGVGEILRD